MKAQRVEFLPRVEGDLRYAREFYASWTTDGAEMFMQRFRETISWIGWNPEMFAKRYRGFRRAIVRRSYFAVFFAVEPSVTTVVAVLDMRRDPRVIRAMLRSCAMGG